MRVAAIIAVLICALSTMGFTQQDNCIGSTANEPDEGKCKPVATPVMCRQPNPGGGGGVGWRWCVPREEDCGLDKTIERYPGNPFCANTEVKCLPTDISPMREGSKCYLFMRLSPKGGQNKDVEQHNPPCSAEGKNISHCKWACLEAPPGHKISGDLYGLAAKEATTPCDELYTSSDIPPGHYEDCPKNGGDCIGWTGWEAVQKTDTSLCGRFKNWSHDRFRCAMMRFTIEPK